MEVKGQAETNNPQIIKKLQEETEKLQEDLNDITAYLSDFLAFLPLAFCDVSPTGMVSNANQSFEELSGFGVIEAAGKKLSDFFLEAPDIQNILTLTAKQEKVRNKELTLISKTGEKIAVSVSFSVKKDSDDNPTGYFVSITNISGLKDVQQKIEKQIEEKTKDLRDSRRALLNILEDTERSKIKAMEEQKKTQIVFDNLVDGLLIFNPEKKLELINPAAENLIGAQKKDILDKSMSELGGIETISGLIKIIKIDRKEIFRKELESYDRKLVLEVTTKFVVSEKKKIATIVIIHDISREKLVERLKSQFVSIAAHQLRTPLSIIKWALNMLLDGEIGIMTRDQKDLIGKANQTNERMIRLINDLLDVARIEEGRFIYQPKTVDLSELVEKAIEQFYGTAKNKKIVLEFKKPIDKTSKIVKADIEKLSLAIKNLVENAISYTPAGGKVTISLQRKEDKVNMTVQDTGIGIPKSQHDRVFSKFFRADNAVRTETEGTGLGLFIVKNIIEAHGGEIGFKSVENKGTTFFLSLPAIG